MIVEAVLDAATLNTDCKSLSVVSGKDNISLHQSLHKSTSANTAANTGSVTNTFNGPVSAPPACVNTASPPDPPRDASSTTSKGYLNTLLSSTPDHHSAADSHIFSNTSALLLPPHHPTDHMTITSGGPVPFTMQHTHTCAVHSSNEQPELMLGASRWFSGHCHWEASEGGCTLGPHGCGL